MDKPRRTVAIDARLVGGSSTGDSTYWTCLVDGLAQLYSDVQFLLITNVEKAPSIPLPSNFEWICRPSRNSRFWSYSVFPSIARKRRAQVIHTQYSLSPLVKGNGVTTVHDVSFFLGPEWFKAKDRAVLRRTVPSAVRRAAKVIAVSDTSRSEIERFVPEASGKVAVTPNACPPWIQKIPKQEATARVQQELGLDLPFVLTVGTRWPRKNMELAVHACNLLSPITPHRLIVTGKEGWGNSELGSRGKAVGYVSNDLLCCLYSSADLYLAPSKHEGFGIPLLEAFRCGCPVICSNGGALPEVADGAAIVMETWSAEGWAATIEEQLHDSSNLDSLRERGVRREREFSWEETARRTMEVYEGVAG